MENLVNFDDGTPFSDKEMRELRQKDWPPGLQEAINRMNDCDRSTNLLSQKEIKLFESRVENAAEKHIVLRFTISATLAYHYKARGFVAISLCELVSPR
jgi:hypothetical protein